MRRYDGWWVVGALTLAAGCSGGPPASTSMVVESLSLEGVVNGEPVDGTAYGDGRGILAGDTGAFFVVGERNSLEIAACPIGASPIEASSANPYDALSGPPIADPGCEPSLQLCGPDGCTSFGPEDVTFEVNDRDRSRLLTLDADSTAGFVHLELGFRTVTTGASGSTRP